MEAEGMRVKALERMPELAGIEWLWEAYLDLTTCRPGGLDIQRIPWTVIQEWADRMDLDLDDRYLLTKVIQYVDKLDINLAKAKK